MGRPGDQINIEIIQGHVPLWSKILGIQDRPVLLSDRVTLLLLLSKNLAEHLTSGTYIIRIIFLQDDNKGLGLYVEGLTGDLRKPLDERFFLLLAYISSFYGNNRHFNLLIGYSKNAQIEFNCNIHNTGHNS